MNSPLKSNYRRTIVSRPGPSLKGILPHRPNKIQRFRNRVCSYTQSILGFFTPIINFGRFMKNYFTYRAADNRPPELTQAQKQQRRRELVIQKQKKLTPVWASNTTKKEVQKESEQLMQKNRRLNKLRAEKAKINKISRGTYMQPKKKMSLMSNIVSFQISPSKKILPQWAEDLKKQSQQLLKLKKVLKGQDVSPQKIAELKKKISQGSDYEIIQVDQSSSILKEKQKKSFSLRRKQLLQAQKIIQQYESIKERNQKNYQLFNLLPVESGPTITISTPFIEISNSDTIKENNVPQKKLSISIISTTDKSEKDTLSEVKQESQFFDSMIIQNPFLPKQNKNSIQNTEQTYRDNSMLDESEQVYTPRDDYNLGNRAVHPLANYHFTNYITNICSQIPQNPIDLNIQSPFFNSNLFQENAQKSLQMFGMNNQSFGMNNQSLWQEDNRSNTSKPFQQDSRKKKSKQFRIC